MKLITLFLLLGSTVASDALSLSSALPSLSEVGQFIASIKSLFGSGSDFAQKFGYNYKDIYNDQLMFQAVNTFTNEKQKEEEVKQVQAMQRDIENETIYFTIISTVMILNSVILSIIVCIKIREQRWSVSERAKERIIDEYNRDRELRVIANRAQGDNQV